MRTARRILLPLLILVYFTSLNFFAVNKPHTFDGGAAGGDARYTIIPFMPPNSDSIESSVSDLNEMGQAVGWIKESPETTCGLHLDISSGEYTQLSGGENCSASGVNNLNQIVGSDRGLGAFWAAPTAEPVALPPHPGHTRSRASHINDAGIVLGRSEDDGRHTGVPVVWRVTLDADGAAHVAGPWLLQHWEDETYWSTTGINEATDGTAQVVGWSNDGTERAVIWTVSLNQENGTLTAGPPVSLETLGMIRYSWSRATGINDSGAVCGISDCYPFCTTGNNPLQLLPAPLDMYCGQPQSINELREIVGCVDIYGENRSVIGDLRAYLWREREAVELNKEIEANSGWHNLQTANCINNDGIIGGLGRFDVPQRGFLLIPNN